MSRSLRVVCCALIATGLLIPASSGEAASPHQAAAADAAASVVLRSLTPEEKVGQLFLVTFHGKQVSESSPIYDLISSYHIGGVILSSANDNFTGPDNTALDAQQLINQLQDVAWTATNQNSADKSADKTAAANYIPLFVGLSQEGDGYPNDQILSGLTQLPNNMAIGATWNTEEAQKVGTVLGQELDALGVNLLLGPSLDVLDRRYSEGGDDLGARTFGGDPYWVSEMGKAYIDGLHEGSQDRLAVIATHFPGLGASDRLPQDEVATVRKSLDQLKQFDLAPFAAVTGNAPDQNSTTDGLLVSHIRIQGLQGNIRAITRPVSLDPSALTQLMSLPAFQTWHNNNGVIVSDDLGSRAVRRFYDPSLQSFDARQVARDAFLAGNDLLYADNFVASGDSDVSTTIVRTLQFFAQKYREDPTFAQRVDTSVTRILALKQRLYPSFDLNSVQTSTDGLSNLNSTDSRQVTNDVASQAVTLISPSQSDLDSVMPQAPDRGDRMVFFTDTLSGRQCSTCQDQVALQVDALQNAIVKLYGPQTSGQVLSGRLSSYNFTDLNNYLNGATNLQPLVDDLTHANWVIFSILNNSKDRAGSDALKRLLSERPDLIQKNQKVIVFAFNAPYFLDATDIAKLTAYYGLYSKGAAFQDVAAKVLFRELTAGGSLPISVPGAGYDLNVASSPDPGQIIPLILDVPAEEQSTVTPVAKSTLQATQKPTLEVTPAQTYKIGDTISLRTGVILDHNNHNVPDGTVVRFRLTKNGDLTTATQVDAVTTQGVAHGAFHIDSSGVFEITVTADPALTSDILSLNIPPKGESAGVTAIAPTPIPSDTATPTITPTPSPTASPTPAPVAATRPGLGEWVLAMLIIAFGSSLVYFFGRWWASLRWGLRWSLCAILGGLVVYAYLAMGLPGGPAWIAEAGKGGIYGLTILGVMLGWGAGALWRSWQQQRAGGKRS
jgi:beta-N-acetylhexosaminidase